VIRARDLSRAFGAQRVLEGLDLHIQRGERAALLGRNGAGKTTLFRCLLGLIPFEGELSVAGLDVRSAGREARAAIGYVPQRAPHFDGTLRDLVRFFAGLRAMDPASVGRRMSDLGLSLEEHGDKPAVALSGGMLQKALLSLAVAEEAKVLLLDEPTANLDPHSRTDFVRSLHAIPEDTTVLLSSHRLADVRAVADRVVVLHSGRIAFDGSLDDLLDAGQAGHLLWIATRDLAVALRLLEGDPRVQDLLPNGGRVGVRTRPRDIADLLADLRRGGLPIDGVAVESPVLEVLLEEQAVAGNESPGEAL